MELKQARSTRPAPRMGGRVLADAVSAGESPVGVMLHHREMGAPERRAVAELLACLRGQPTVTISTLGRLVAETRVHGGRPASATSSPPAKGTPA